MQKARNPFLLIQSETSEMWNDVKGLDWTSEKGSKKRIVKRIKTHILVIKELIKELEEKELPMLEIFHDLK